mgnify:CR=1 FL=1
MRTQTGVTLISVTIYVIVMVIVVAVITVLTSYFYKNVDITATRQDLNQQYTKFNTYFIEEVNKKGNKILDIGETQEDDKNAIQKYIVFSSGNQYTYVPQNKGIYINQVKIAENITNCTFTSQEDENGKTIVTVVIQGDNFEKTTTYTLVD